MKPETRAPRMLAIGCAVIREQLLAKTKEAAAKGEYELFKTRSICDSIAQNPQWLGEEPKRISELMPV
ncbi:MAG: hypothetical protein ACR2MW_05910 [Chthoniobacterales bacterium]